MDHNYTILTTGKFSPLGEPLPDRRIAIFAFAGTDDKRISQLAAWADDDTAVRFDGEGFVMVGYLEVLRLDDGIFGLFHFHLAEVR